MASQSPRGVWANLEERAKRLPRKRSGLAEGATRKFAQGTAARRVELKMDRRRRCFSVAGRKGTCSLVAPWRRAILNSTIVKAYRLHNTGSPAAAVVGISSNVRLIKLILIQYSRTIWIADAHRDGTRFVVRAELIPSNYCVTAASVTMSRSAVGVWAGF